MSPRDYPEALPPIEYSPGDIVGKVQQGDKIHIHGHTIGLSKAFKGYPIALRPTREDGVYDVYFCPTKIQQIDLNHP